MALTGEGGLLPGLIKLALERGLAAELTGHLGYEKGDPVGRLLPNARNGQLVQDGADRVRPGGPGGAPGAVTARSPRGWCPSASAVPAADDTIIPLHAGGITLRDIQFHLALTIGAEVSHETISKIADEVPAWQRRPLESLCPAIYPDALIAKVKDVAIPIAASRTCRSCAATA